MLNHCCLCVRRGSGPEIIDHATEKRLSEKFNSKRSDSLIGKVDGTKCNPRNSIDLAHMSTTSRFDRRPTLVIETTATLAESEQTTCLGSEQQSYRNSRTSLGEISRKPSQKSFNFWSSGKPQNPANLSTPNNFNVDRLSNPELSTSKNLNSSSYQEKRNSFNLSLKKAKESLIKKASTKWDGPSDVKTVDSENEDTDELSQLPQHSSNTNATNRLHTLFINKLTAFTNAPNMSQATERLLDSNHFTTDFNNTSSIHNNTRRGSLHIFRNSDEPIVTPFAQILASLRKVRTNFISITNTSSTRDVRSGQRYSIQRDENVPNIVSNIVATQPETSSAPSSLANETLHELEWCLERLENIQTHRSVSDMASSKFKKLLNKELSQFASDGSKSGTQISEYICSTFLDPANEPDVLSPQKDQMINHDSLMPLMMKKKIKDKTRFVTDGSNFTRLDILARNCDLHVGVKAEHVAKVQGIGIAGEIVPHYGVKHSEELDEFLKKNPLNRWGLDVFELAKITEYPLTCITFTILKDRGTLEKFKIPHWNAIRYFMLAENHYNSKAPYHNRIHAADVVQSTNVLLDAPALQNLFGDLEVFAVIFACAIHDVDHPGVTNQYLINTNDSLAVLYNDSSVLENHHLAVAFTLLNQNGCDLTVNLSKMQRSSFRRMVIDMVLATDMSKHMSLLADLKTMVETKKVSGISVLNLEKYTNRIQILQNMVHCADLSNPAKPLELYKQWNSRIMEEFFFQGDLERAADLDISPMCDRKTASLEKSQVSFIDFIVHPLWETWSELVHPDGQEILELLQSNREWYFSSITNETQKAEEIFHSEKLQSTKEEEVEHDPKPSQI